MPDNTDDAEFMGRCFPPPAGPIRAEEDASGLEEEPSQDPGHTGRRRRRRHHHGRRMKQFWPYSPDGVVPENFLDPPEQRLFQDDMPLCIMVHGAGTEETVSTNPIPPFVDYWGDSNLRYVNDSACWCGGLPAAHCVYVVWGPQSERALPRNALRALKVGGEALGRPWAAAGIL